MRYVFLISVCLCLGGCLTTSQEKKKTVGSILLIQGSAPFDCDGNVPDKRAGRYQKTNFYLNLASSLEAMGWKVFRYSKPGVTQAGIDFNEYKKTDLSVLGKQLNNIWGTMPKDQPRIVFAWSEGSLHVHLLPMREIDGVVLLGGISTNIRDVVLSQAKNAQDRKNTENELSQVPTMAREEMLGLDRPAGRLIDEFNMKDNWIYFSDFPLTRMLVLHGDADQEVSVAQAYEWKKHLPKNNIEIEIGSGLNHSFGAGDVHGAAKIVELISSWWAEKAIR